MGFSFPIKASSNGRYYTDQNGVPFRAHGAASWDYTLNLTLTDLRSYLDDQQSRGIKALLLYANPVAYAVGSNAPWALQLGGSSAGTAALPFSKNISGGTWNGDPTFTNHDAAFANPVDGYWEWLRQVADEGKSRNMVAFFFFCYLGFNAGATDGWWQTLTNAGNTQTVCNTFGQYLANGNGTFAGFKNQSNIVWVCGGDYLPPNGAEGSLRMKKILQGMQSAGDTHLVSTHWQSNFLSLDQTDVSALLTSYSSYTHGAYPTPGPTYPEGRASYSQTPAAPVFLIETNYWGDHGATRAQLRYYHWGSALSCIAGAFMGFSPLWIFAVSPDGSTPTSISGVTNWQPSTAYVLNQYVSHVSNWYRCITGGTSAGSGGPTGTGSNITDNTVHWTFVTTVSGTMGGMANLLGESAETDFQVLDSVLGQIAWWQLVPSALASTGTIITAGQGTVATWSDGTAPSNNMDWIPACAASDNSALIAYVPDDHSGSFTIDRTRFGIDAYAVWVDPSNGAVTSIGAIANTGTQAFTVPGTNASGAKDWVLLVRSPYPTDPVGYGFAT